VNEFATTANATVAGAEQKQQEFATEYFAAYVNKNSKQFESKSAEFSEHVSVDGDNDGAVSCDHNENSLNFHLYADSVQLKFC
jgi:hypothetical protein